jgi:hypothetical protein
MLDLRQPLLGLLDEAFVRRAWHGPNLRGALRGVTARQAAWRPATGRHSIWELVLHTAYWKYAVRQRLQHGKRGSFPRAPSNFPKVPVPADDKAWRADLALLRDQHDALHQAIAALGPVAWTPRNLRLIQGIALHDVYHAGQVSLLKRLQRVTRR